MRHIGIQHRVKATADGAGHPTRVAIIEGGNTAVMDLKDEQAELDFIFSLQPDDTIGMMLGGSGDYLAYAVHRQAQTIGASVHRLPTHKLKYAREHTDGFDADKSDDHKLLAELVRTKLHRFYPVTETDAKLVLVRQSWRNLWEAMRARIAGEQRFRQNFIGRTFTAPDGLYPEGAIEQIFKEAKASDQVLKNLIKEEKARERELIKALEATDVYTQLFQPLPGVGPKIAGRIISAIIDVRRFPSAAKLKAYMGVHVLKDGSFPRKRRGVVANWHNDARQALYLLGDQFNRRPGTEWGDKLRENKAHFRRMHPEAEMVNRGTEEKPRMVKCYTDGHIHKMATWRTLTQFVEWLYTEWKALDEEGVIEPVRFLKEAA